MQVFTYLLNSIGGSVAWKVFGTKHC